LVNNDEQAFRKAMEANPNDEGLKKVFADWLDEHDRPEEATWYRAWTAQAAQESMKWFEEFASGHTTRRRRHFIDYIDGDYDEYGHRAYTAQEIIEAAKDYVATMGDKWLTQYGRQSLQDSLCRQDKRIEFWTHLAMATGMYIPIDGLKDHQPFSCSC
jgi:uncharacterized protein (TIGR02996 family)